MEDVQLQGLADHTAEDVLLENRILKTRMHDEKIGRQRADDEIRFLKQQLASRDRTLASVKESLSVAEQRNGQLQRLVDDKEIAIAELTRKAGLLREKADEAFFSKQRGEDVHATTGPTTVGVVIGKTPKLGGGGPGGLLGSITGAAKPHSAKGGFSFKDRFHDIVTMLRLKKKLRQIKLRHEATMQNVETDLMALEDERSQQVHECGTINKKFVPMEDGGEEASQNNTRSRTSSAARRSSLISFEGVRRHGRGLSGHLPYKETVHFVTHEDKFVDAKIHASAFATQLQPLRSDIVKHVSTMKDFIDNSLSALYFIFSDVAPGGRKLLAQPVHDYEKEIKAILTKTKIHLFELMKTAHAVAKDVSSAEKKVKQQWLLDHRANHKDVAVSVDIPPPEDPRIAKQQEQLDFLKTRISHVQEEQTRKVADLELSRDAAESTTKFIHAKIFDLHDATYEALHAVFRQRYRWTARFPNSFHGIERKPATTKALAVKYNLKLGEAVNEDVQYLKKFAEYFLSDDLFGADLVASAKDEVAASAEAFSKKRGGEALGQRRRTIDAARAMSNKLDEVDEWATTGDTEVRQLTRSRSLADIPRGASAGEKENYCGFGGPPPRVVRSACNSPELKPSRPSTAGSQRSMSKTSAGLRPAASSAASTPVEGFHRMEEWHKHQQNVWEQKKQRPSQCSANVAPPGINPQQEVMLLSKVTLQFDQVDALGDDQIGGSARLARKGSFRRQL